MHIPSTSWKLSTLSNVSPLFLSLSSHRHEPNRRDDLFDRPSLGLHDHHQILDTCSDRSHEPAAHAKLIHERLWHTTRRGGDHDGVKGRVLRPTIEAIADPYVDIPVPQLLQQRFGFATELGNGLDGVNLSYAICQDGCLVSRPGPDLEYPHFPLWVDRRAHDGHDIWLRDCLSVADRKRAITVCVISHCARNEPMPRYRAHCREHCLIGDSPRLNLGQHHALTASLFLGLLGRSWNATVFLARVEVLDLNEHPEQACEHAERQQK